LQRAELATRIGCATVTLQKIEADEQRPSRQLAERRAAQLASPASCPSIDCRSPGPISPGRPTCRVRSRRSPGACGRLRKSARLYRAEVRPLTLTCAPGIGKTRLAIEAASELRSAFADGVVFVSFAPLSDPDLVLPAIAHALDVGTSGRQPYCVAAAFVRIAAAAWLPGSSYGERRSW
jgi:hypothetical protein